MKQEMRVRFAEADQIKKFWKLNGNVERVEGISAEVPS